MQTIFTLITALIPLILWAYTQTVNGVFKEKAKQNPHSLAARMLRITEFFVDSTIFKDLKTKQDQYAPELFPNTSLVREINRLYGTNDLVVINNSTSISIDFTRKISEKSIRYMGNPFVHISIIIILSSIFSLFFSSLIGNIFGSKFFIGYFIFCDFLTICVFAFLLGGQGGFITTLLSLRKWPNVLIVIDHTLVMIESAWVGGEGHLELNNGKGEFVVADIDQSVGIAWKHLSTGASQVVFLIPKSFLDLLFPDKKLYELCIDLNKLLKKDYRVSGDKLLDLTGTSPLTSEQIPTL